MRLGAQGPQYDELHQAAGAFTHLGSPPVFFSLVNVRGYPLLNMPYSAAVKTHLFGLYLRVRGEFRLEEWRGFGILLAGLAIAVLSAGAAAALRAPQLALLLALTVTDATVLLLARHDWGPVVLALLLRASLLALWLRAETCRPERVLPLTAGMGVVVGLAIFEKLSSVALVAPLALLLLSSRRERGAARWTAAAAGLAVGIAPLVLVNLATRRIEGWFISAQDMSAPVDRSPATLAAHVVENVGLGGGTGAASLVLGLPPSPVASAAETGLAAAALVLTAVLALLALRLAPQARWALASLAGWASLLATLLMLPRPTWIHHWVQATPLQYLAVALALAAAGAAPARARRGLRTVALALTVCCGAWLAVRAANLWRLEGALLAGLAAPGFDPDLRELGDFAARMAPRAVFVATDWGVATQIYCLANGRPGLVHEPFWRYGGIDQVEAIHRDSGKPILYLVRTEPPSRVGGDSTRRIERDVAASDAWIELPLDVEARAWPGLHLRKFVRAGAAPAGPAAAPPPRR